MPPQAEGTFSCCIHIGSVKIKAMEVSRRAHAVTVTEGAERKPTLTDVIAGLLLIATVILHVVAMIPHYVDSGSNSQPLLSQPDQAALYSILAAAWAGVLVIGLLGPKWLEICAAAAVGVAVTELGFRVADLGWYFRYGTSEQGAGLWIMTVAWAVGAGGAGMAVLAARRRRDPALLSSSLVEADRPEWTPDWPPPPMAVSGPDQTLEVPTVQPTDPTLAAAVPAVTWPTTSALSPRSGDTMALASLPDEDPTNRPAWTVAVILLALATAGFFLPAWDHYVWVNTSSGRSGGFSLGNAFSNPWQVTLGNVLCAVALAAVPIAAIRLRNRAAGAALAIGGLAVLASQFVSAVIQLDQPTPASIATPGIDFTVRLTAWFTLDVLAAFLLLAAFLVGATLRRSQQNSLSVLPNAPDFRSRSIPWPS
jgi:hypothetical protein